MRTGTRIAAGLVAGGALLGAAAAAVASGRPIVESISTRQKISNLQGSAGAGLVLATGDKFGQSLADIGDLDGDGIPDLAVGAPGTLGPLATDTGTGAVWICFMRTDGTVRQAEKIDFGAVGIAGALQKDDRFGQSVAALGDLDGDGHPDIAVGAPNDDDAGLNRGAVYILYLLPTGLPHAARKVSNTDATLTIPSDSEQFGDAVASLGDMDGPGGANLVLAVGAPGDADGDSPPSFLRGAVFLLPLTYNSGTGLLSVGTVAKISDTQGTPAGFVLHNTDFFGTSVARLADLDNDGRPELAVGASLDDDNADGESGNSANHGAVYILFLNSSLAVTRFTKVSEISGGFTGDLHQSDFFGESLAGVGDSDANGVPDMLVGASGDDDGASAAGAVWLTGLDYSPVTLLASVTGQLKISNSSGNLGNVLMADDAFGSAAGSVGDLNNDLAEDYAVGAPGDDDGRMSSGAAYLLFGTPPPPVPVALVSFAAAREADGIAVSWEVPDGSTRSLYSLYRQLPDAPRQRIGDRALTGQSRYEVIDRSAGEGPMDYWLEETSPAGRATWYGPLHVDGSDRPAAFELSANWPNPFHAATTIRYALTAPAAVKLTVHDLAGRVVAVLVDRFETAGAHDVVWDGATDQGAHVSPGVYFLHLQSAAGVLSRKVVVAP